MRFLLDECITEPVANALAAVRCDVVYAPTVAELGVGAKDEAVYGYAARNGMVVITQDREMGSDKIKQQVVVGSGCGVFILRRPKIDSMRLKLIRILTVWDSIELAAKGLNPPYIFECRAQGNKLSRLR